MASSPSAQARQSLQRLRDPRQYRTMTADVMGILLGSLIVVGPRDTGTYAHSWRGRLTSPTSFELVNAAKYSGYANRGFTRRGEGTASTYGGTPYTEVARERVDGKIRDRISKGIREILTNG